MAAERTRRGVATPPAAVAALGRAHVDRSVVHVGVGTDGPLRVDGTVGGEVERVGGGRGGGARGVHTGEDAEGGLVVEVVAGSKCSRGRLWGV